MPLSTRPLVQEVEILNKTMLNGNPAIYAGIKEQERKIVNSTDFLSHLSISELDVLKTEQAISDTLFNNTSIILFVQ